MTDREKIGQAMLNCAAGYRAEDGLLAHADVLGTSVGAIQYMAGETIESAEAVIDEIATAAKQHIRQNWGCIETQENH